MNFDSLWFRVTLFGWLYFKYDAQAAFFWSLMAILVIIFPGAIVDAYRKVEK